MDDTKIKEQDERSEWVTPTIKEWDVVTETQSGAFPNQLISDGVTAYS